MCRVRDATKAGVNKTGFLKFLDLQGASEEIEAARKKVVSVAWKHTEKEDAGGALELEKEMRNLAAAEEKAWIRVWVVVR